MGVEQLGARGQGETAGQRGGEAGGHEVAHDRFAVAVRAVVVEGVAGADQHVRRAGDSMWLIRNSSWRWSGPEQARPAGSDRGQSVTSAGPPKRAVLVGGAGADLPVGGLVGRAGPAQLDGGGRRVEVVVAIGLETNQR